MADSASEIVLMTECGRRSFARIAFDLKVVHVGSDDIRPTSGGALAIAAHSIAEANNIPYVYAAFAPITLPSAHHAPPTFGMLGHSHGDDDDPVALWHADRERWNAMWSAPLNRQRERLGLPAVDEVRDHLFTRTPWLAADPALAPWPDSAELEVSQTGA